MALMAQQAGSGTGVVRGNVTAVPAFDPMVEGKLAHTPINAEAVKMYELNGDGTFGKEIAVSADGGEDGGYVLGDDNAVTLPKGKKCIAVYEYDATDAIAIVNSATEFPKACELILEILGCDVCNQEELVYAYLNIPNFKLSPDFDWQMTTDGNHPFSGTAMQDYCDEKKELYKLVIVE